MQCSEFFGNRDAVGFRAHIASGHRPWRLRRQLVFASLAGLRLSPRPLVQIGSLLFARNAARVAVRVDGLLVGDLHDPGDSAAGHTVGSRMHS
jgi:hypothetical protein